MRAGGFAPPRRIRLARVSVQAYPARRGFL